MANKTGKCMNLDCDNYKQVVEVSAGEEFVCPICGQPLEEDGTIPTGPNWILICTIAAIIILGGGAGAYFATDGNWEEIIGWMKGKDSEKEHTPPTETTNVDVKSISIAEGKTLQLKVGDAKVLTLALVPENTNEQISWRTSNLDVAKVSNSGLVEAVAKGKATITAVTDRSGNSASIEVSVLEKGGGTLDGGPIRISDYATYEGDVKNGKPEGNGTMTFTKKAIVPGSKGDIEAQPGEFATGKWVNGRVNLVTLYQKNGNQVTILPSGRN